MSPEPMKLDWIVIQPRGEAAIRLDCAKPTMATATLPFMQIGDKLIVPSIHTAWWQPDTLRGVYEIYDRAFAFGYHIELVIYVESFKSNPTA